MSARGYIVPVGGAEEKIGDVAILRRFAALCGGEKCRVAIIPTASMLSETGARYEQLFRDLGVATTPIDLSPAFDDKYRAFAVQYLGEYRLR